MNTLLHLRAYSFCVLTPSHTLNEVLNYWKRSLRSVFSHFLFFRLFISIATVPKTKQNKHTHTNLACLSSDWDFRSLADWVLGGHVPDLFRPTWANHSHECLPLAALSLSREKHSKNYPACDAFIPETALSGTQHTELPLVVMVVIILGLSSGS